LKHDRKVDAVSAVAVSVIIPSYNAAPYLEEALRSVSEQTLGDFECLVIDDASTDASVDVARQFAKTDSRFRSIILPSNGGVSAARNQGFAEAQGRWIAVLDADDLYLPARLEVLTEIGDRRGADLVFDDQLVTEYPRVTSAHHAFKFSDREFAFSQEDFFCGSRLFRKSFPTGYMKPLMRREFLRRTEVAYDPAVSSGEDFLFYSELFASRPRCIGTSFTGYVYRRRRGSLSRSDTYTNVHAELGDRVLRNFGGQLSPRSRDALAGRRRDLERLMAALPALSALRQRDWHGLARSLVTEPKAVATCLRIVRKSVIRSWFTMRAKRRLR
jgi:succinoglycan biosynthesis protein ExoO